MKQPTLDWFYAQVIALQEDMFRFAFSILREKESCEDAVSSAIILAHDHLPQLRSTTAFRVWFTKIVRNECYRILREHGRTAALMQESQAEDVDAAGRADLARALGALDPDRRAALTLYYLLGYSVRETAEILQIPVGTVKSRLSRARDELRNLLGGDEDA